MSSASSDLFAHSTPSLHKLDVVNSFRACKHHQVLLFGQKIGTGVPLQPFKTKIPQGAVLVV